MPPIPVSSQVPETICLSPVTDYYIRKLIQQNFSQLVSLQPAQGLETDLGRSSIALFNRLTSLHSNVMSIAQTLDTLVLQHQTLRTQGGRYQSELKQVEAQILHCFALKRTQTIAEAKILVIDDTPETLRLLTTTLSEQGYAVEQLSSGAAALKHVRDRQPDLILLDVMMPGIDGYEVCERLKLDPQTCHIPILFLSAVDDALNKVKAFDLGGVDYVTKPFQLEEVLARIEYQLKLYQRSKQQREAGQTYQNFFENAVEGMFQTTLNGRFLRANQALAERLGYDSPQDLIDSVQDIARQLYTIPQRRSQFVLYLEQYGQTEEFEAEVFCKNGDRIWIREKARAVRDAEGNLQFYEGTVQDITEQKRLEAVQGI
ncbi:response regulator [Leptolyngbya sp. NIES-2104]|uniref:response regulator n=1 Tax=Leptolyngbya sp. NIES-2104 TaxID=1552121 RepID=UPI00073EBC0C|nr:response regulator [Leptolyngbya sp. NIES-2104]